MNKNFSEYLSLFFNDYLIIQRNFSKNTILSYKYTFRLLFSYMMNIKNIKIEDISFRSITKDLVKDFLNYLEKEKHCSINTRNQRLSAIKSFYQFVGIENPDNLNNIQTILGIHLKKDVNKEMDYYTLEELKKFFDSIDLNTYKGRRNLVLLSLMYDSAVRVSEITNLKVCDINLTDLCFIKVLGKGNKERTIPIMNNTKELLIKYIKENKLGSSDYLFGNSKGEKICERTIQIIISKYNTTEKIITPHSLRRTRAIHLLESGIDLVYIRDLLGHSSVTTTERYAKASVEYKRKMLEKYNNEIYSNEKEMSWNTNPDILNEIMNFK